MDKNLKLTYPIFTLALSFSCAKQKQTVQEPYKPELVTTANTDNLKFTLGMRANFQDSKANY